MAGMGGFNPMAEMGGIPMSSQKTPKKLKGDKITAKNKEAVMKAVMKNEKLMKKAMPWLSKGLIPPFVKLPKPRAPPAPVPKPPTPPPRKPAFAWPTMKELKKLNNEDMEDIMKNLPSLEGVERVERKELEPGERPMASAIDSIMQAKKTANKMLEYKAKAEQKDMQRDMKQSLIDEFGEEEYKRKMDIMKEKQAEKKAKQEAKAARKKMRKIQKVEAAARAIREAAEAARAESVDAGERPTFLDDDDGDDLEGTTTRASGLFFQKAMSENLVGLRAHSNIIPN